MSKKIKYLIFALCVSVLVGVVLFFSLSNRDDSTIDETATATENPSESVYEKLDEVYISVSHNYINSLFGEPKISVNESENLKSNFYILDDFVLRTVTEDDSVVAFFITSSNEEQRIPVQSIDSKEFIGEITFLDSEFPNPILKSDVSGNSRYNYYAEIQGTGRYAMYNYYLFAFLPYGFMNDDSIQLSTKHSHEKTDILEDLNPLRETAKPNTFGVIANGYEEMITILPEVDNWADIYYLLTK